MLQNKDIYFCVRSRCYATMAKTLTFTNKKGSQKSEQFRTEKNNMNFTSRSLSELGQYRPIFFSVFKRKAIQVGMYSLI